MKILVSCFTEYENNTLITAAYIEIEKEYLDWIKEQIDIFRNSKKEDTNIPFVEFADSTPIFLDLTSDMYDTEEESKKVDAFIGRYRRVVEKIVSFEKLKETVTLKGIVSMVSPLVVDENSCSIRIFEHGICWRANVSYGGAEVYTSIIDLEELA
jgi:hypothetical protein